MKIFANSKVYVQKNDLAYFLRGAEGLSVPSSIFDELFGEQFIVMDNNRYEFIEFSKPEEIEFFKKCDWMVDYNQFDNMSEEEIIECGYKINEERNEIVKSYNLLSKKEKEKQYMKTSTQIELLEFKMMSVRDILWHKQGHLKFDLPAGVKANFINSDNKKNKFKKVLRRIKKNNN